MNKINNIFYRIIFIIHFLIAPCQATRSTPSHPERTSPFQRAFQKEPELESKVLRHLINTKDVKSVLNVWSVSKSTRSSMKSAIEEAVKDGHEFDFSGKDFSDEEFMSLFGPNGPFILLKK